MLLFCAVFMGASCGLKALQAAPYLSGESYQDTGQFRNLLREYQNQIAEAFALDQELEQADLTYVERQQIMERMQQLEQSLDPSATNFRFVVRSADGEIVTSNLEKGTSLADQVQEINYAFFILGEFFTSDAGEAYAAESSIPPGLSENTTSPGKTSQEKTVYTVECGVPSMDQLGTVQDDFAQISYRYYQANYCFSQWLIIAGVCLAAAAAALFFILLQLCGGAPPTGAGVRLAVRGSGGGLRSVCRRHRPDPADSGGPPESPHPGPDYSSVPSAGLAVAEAGPGGTMGAGIDPLSALPVEDRCRLPGLFSLQYGPVQRSAV